MKLPEKARSKFLAGLDADLWGETKHRTKGITRILKDWLEEDLAATAPQHEWVTRLQRHLALSDLARTPAGTIRNLFYYLNMALDEALPTLLWMTEAGSDWVNRIQLATCWLQLGDTSYAEALRVESIPTDRMTEKELEASYLFHLAYFNHLHRHGLAAKQPAEVETHFHRMRQFETSLTVLRSLRLHCTGHKIYAEGAASIGDEIMQAPSSYNSIMGAEMIHAFKSCLDMINDTSGTELPAQWLETKNAITHPDFPKKSTEYRELLNHLLNIAVTEINRGRDAEFWNIGSFQLLGDALHNQAMLENGALPAQHLVNYCRLAILAGEVAQVQKEVGTLGEALSKEDKQRGELAFCQATMLYALEDYDAAWAMIGQFQPLGKRKLAYYVLRIKIMLEGNFREVEATLQAFAKWLGKNKKVLGTHRYSVEKQRIDLLHRLVAIQPRSKKARERLWSDLQSAAIDTDWLQKMYHRWFASHI